MSNVDHTVKANVSTETRIKDPKSILHAFQHSLPNCRMVLKNGKPINFIAHMYYTNIQAEIDELMKEIEDGSPYLRIPEQATIAVEDLDPMEVLRKKFIAEYEAKKAAAIEPGRDMGETERKAGMVVATSATVGDNTKESNAPKTAAPNVIKVGPRG